MKATAPLSEKILCLGVDGLDPRLTRKYVDEGKMPHVKQLIEKGACREDLVLLGGHPTVTPPMWTTLATGCYANVHGITGFYRRPDLTNPEYDLDEQAYNLDSRYCKAEPLWNVFAEAGKKTLVWHWPGSSWPPTSDSPNLYVVDGTVPGSVNVSAQVEKEFFFIARDDIEIPNFIPAGAQNIQAACVIEDVHVERDVAPVGIADRGLGAMAVVPPKRSLITKPLEQGQWGSLFGKQDVAVSSIKPAKGWENAPDDALECAMYLSKGALRRPILILKNDAGEYDRIAIYKSKKSADPICIIHKGEFKREVIDVSLVNEKEVVVNRNMALLELTPDGKNIRMWVSNAMDTSKSDFWHPQSLYNELASKIGFPPPTCMIGSQEKDLIQDVMLQNWYSIADYQAAALKYMIDEKDVEVIFSHFHSVDLQSHRFIRYLYDKGENVVPVEQIEQYMEDVYKQVDYYVSQFMDYLDKGWTIFLFSDHAQICGKHLPDGMGDIVGINIPLMQKLGFTVLKKDENGNDIPEIDWTKTKAIAWGEQHIYLNLIGRTDHGIVDPKDQYELEEEIITALYGYRNPETGKRIISVALRNRDAVLLGQGGPEAGDICYWVAEGYNYDHADTLSTAIGEGHTSVSPIFIAAGKGIKPGYTDRVIRQIDFAPTVAVIGGVRMPAQCEGAPVYQIIE